MASSGSLNTTGYSGRYVEFSWNTSNKSVEKNQTTVAWKLTGRGGNSGYYKAAPFKVAIDGATVYSSSTRIELWNGTVVKTGTYTFTHDTAGKKSFSVSVEAAIYSGSVNCRGSKNFTLDDIPRATTPTLSASSVDMGGKVTINLPRASSSFVHDLAYSFEGGAWAAISLDNTGTSHTWTVPDLAVQIPKATSGTAKIRCITKDNTSYNGGKNVGIKYVNIALKVPASVVPVINSATTAEATAGLATQFGAFVQSKSSLNVSINAFGAKGSEVTSYKTTIDKGSYTGSSFTTRTLNTAGTLKMVVSVTDSRGRTASKTYNIPVLEYFRPRVTNFSATRVNEADEPDLNGKAARLEWSYEVASLGGKNTADMEIKTKLSTDTEFNTLCWFSTNPKESSSVNYVGDTDLSLDYRHDFQLTLVDWFGNKNEYITSIGTEQVFMDLDPETLSVSIGEVAEFADTFGVRMPIFLRNGFKPNIIPNGTDLDRLTAANFYVGKNNETAGYLHCPVTGFTFSLEVLSNGDSGQLMQRLTTSSKTYPQTLMRFFHSGSWSAWISVGIESGWRKATLTSDWTNYSAGSYVRYRRSGNMVEVKGEIKPTNPDGIPYATTHTEICTLPWGYRPGDSLGVHKLCQGSSNAVWLLYISTEGGVYFSRYRNGNDGSTVWPGNWLPFHVTFMVD